LKWGELVETKEKRKGEKKQQTEKRESKGSTKRGEGGIKLEE
jgi:hypothetical protein